ncbi:MAG: YqzL family protein [Firmicutes bacterium]|nr:YqzL family protein [Bacillota bacterium]
MKLTADFFWKLFEATGSITAYLLYKQYRTIKAIMN